MCATQDTIESVLKMCRAAAEANRASAARCGNVVCLTKDNAAEVMVVADLHGNRLNFKKLLAIADLEQHPRRHLVLQEVCHGGPQYPGEGGGCMSHLLLEDCIRLKTQYPERFHFLLSNHELAELGDFPICKGRRMLNLQFRAGINELYGRRGEEVRAAYLDFLAGCPLAVRVGQSVFISHSSPDGCDQQPFDVSIFERPLTAADYKSGSPAFKLVWGRDFRAANAEAFARAVGAEVLVHGHEPCESGYSAPNKRQVIIDGCCAHATYLLLPVEGKLTQADVVSRIYNVHNGQRARSPRP